MFINYKNINSVCLKLVSILLIIYLSSVNCTDYKCGIPGTSLKSSIKSGFTNEKAIDNGIKVKYSCDYNDAPFLIGQSERECMDGLWTHSIPKCATLYTGKYEYNFTLNGNAINISLAKTARIAGIVVKISSLEPIKVVNIKNIPSPECFAANSTFKDKIPFQTKRYSTLFHCPTKDVEFSMHSSISWILITFSEKFKNCELISCQAILEFIELYEIINDECFKPDVPAFARLVPVKHNGSLIRFKYQCEDHFIMQERLTSEIVCTPLDEWSVKRLPRCVPNITCEVEPIDELKVTFNWLWSESDAVVGTVATFECVDNRTKLNGTAKRECRSDGEWSEELPQCIQITTTTVEMTTTTEATTKSLTSTPNPYVYSEYTNQYVTHPRPPPVPPTENYPKPYPGNNPYPYPPPYITTTLLPVQQYPNLISGQTPNTLNTIHFVYIFLGILLGILITISVIYYINKKRSQSMTRQTNRVGQLRAVRTNQSQRNDEYYDHMANHNLNESRLSNGFINETVDSNQLYPYDSAGYIQIEAVESMRMNAFKKYENYDGNSSRKQSKPLPQVPKG